MPTHKYYMSHKEAIYAYNKLYNEIFHEEICAYHKEYNRTHKAQRDRWFKRNESRLRDNARERVKVLREGEMMMFGRTNRGLFRRMFK